MDMHGQVQDGDGQRGLVVDYGGVLTTSVTRSFRAFCREMGLASELVKETFLEAYGRPGEDGPVHQVETGRITGGEFASALAARLSERAGMEIAPDDLLQQLFAHVELDERMWEAVLTVRAAGVRTCLLSNSWGDEGYPRDRLAACFDAVVISGEVGLRKPDPPIYELAATRLALPPGACVFVDDLDTNVHAAEQVGMTGVVHRRTEETLPRLAALFDVDLTASDRRR